MTFSLLTGPARPGSLSLAAFVLALSGLGGPSAQAGQRDAYYARLDGGASYSQSAKGDIATGNGFGQTFGESGQIGVGFGRSFASSTWYSWRADATIDRAFSFVSDHAAIVGPASAQTPLAARIRARATTFMVNGYADVDTGTALTPYVGLGLGGSLNRVAPIAYTLGSVAAANELSYSQVQFAYRASLGVAIAVTSGIAVDAAFRHVEHGDLISSGTLVSNLTGKTASQPPLKGALATNGWTIGLRASF